MKRPVLPWLLAGLLVAAQIQPAFSLPSRPAGLARPALAGPASGRHWGHGHGHHHHGGVWIGLGTGLLLGLLLAPPPYYRYAAPPRYYGYAAPPPRGRPCHPVVRDSFDGYGRPMRLGATMCYRYEGRAYIVPGSRHIVGYY